MIEIEKIEGKRTGVNHPSHYELCSLECLDIMELLFGEKEVMKFCMMNSYKYMHRYKYKNGKEDLDKAEWYLKEVEKYDFEMFTSDEEGLYKRLKTTLYKCKKGIKNK